MTLNKYRVFSKIAETGNMRKAAEEMMYTCQALSRIIKKLEDEFGFELLIRGRDGVKLTRRAEQILPVINSMIEQEDHLFLEVSRIQSEEGYAKAVQIGACGSIVMKNINETLDILRQEHPGLKVGVHYNANDRTTIKKLSECKLDFALMVEGCQGNMEFEPLFEETYYAVFPKDHELAKRSAISLEELIQYPNVVVDDNPYYNEIMANADHHTIVVDEEIMIPSIILCNEAVGIMSGISQFDFDSGLKVVPLKEGRSRVIGIATRPGNELSKSAMTVIRALKRSL